MKPLERDLLVGELILTVSDQYGNSLLLSDGEKGYDQMNMRDFERILKKMKQEIKKIKHSYERAMRYTVHRKYKEDSKDAVNNNMYYKTFAKALKKAKKIPFSEIKDNYSGTTIWRHQKTKLEKELIEKFNLVSIIVRELHHDVNTKEVFNNGYLSNSSSEGYFVEAIVFDCQNIYAPKEHKLKIIYNQKAVYKEVERIINKRIKK